MAKKSFSNDLLRDLHAEPLTQLAVIDEGVTEISSLSNEENERLTICEEVIDKGLKTFIEVGNALFEIRNNKLYRGSFTTFEAYCKERWQLKRQRAYELMGAAEVVNQLSENNLSEISDKSNLLPTKESHANALTQIPVTLRFQVWRAVVEESLTTKKPITAKMIVEQTELLSKQSEELATPKEPTEEELKEIVLKKMRSKVAKAKLDDIRVEISGRWLLKNQLVDVWREIRQNPNEEIGVDYRVQITLSQAEKMGIIRRI
ncbi:hypothetical protein Emtol_0315 (plasmid) [Emticicia oligotrophica DSM 17448]|uniref:DUF3102 domain-containing protein n=1 Tax=Emticicia oligotrophica (strain DSM 17448 / CIP 109782 / MTCC 6937 / GPTSA100-15) TaxID=929562 RepID=A0ABM5N828_EMTOG|nr:hypothetical protein [Emticicia oligotrophica]AFK05582.1 hypothetical protein Emtol_0315 [Emticicia oligotrophica DSM 17448]